LFRNMGELIKKGDYLGSIEDILGNRSVHVRAPCDGVIIGLVANPLTYQGDAIVHIAKLDPDA